MQTIMVVRAVAKISYGATLATSGFMAVGAPERLIDEIARQGKCDLMVIANDAALPGSGIGKLTGARLICKEMAALSSPILRRSSG